MTSHRARVGHGTGCAALIAVLVLLGFCKGAGGTATPTTRTNGDTAQTTTSLPPSRIPMDTPSPSPPPTPSPPVVVAGCVQPDSSSSHVYNPDRLQVLKPCISVTGTIDFIRHEADGDLHVGLKLDQQFAGLVNPCNATCLKGAEHGDLVVEPVCEGTVTQADAKSACVGYHNPLVIPPVGSHVEMGGAYVLDRDHGWTEIHPLQEVHVI